MEMEMGDSCTMSMTPPCSPLSQPIQGCKQIITQVVHDDWQPICFSCQGAVEPYPRERNTDPDSFLHSGIITWLTSGKDNWLQATNANLIELYHKQFLPNVALEESLDELFYLTRKNISWMGPLEDIDELSSESVPAQFMDIRRELRYFSNYVKTYIMKHLSVERATSFVPQLVQHLKYLLLHLERLSDLPTLITANPLQHSHQSSNHHIYHMHLELHWAVVETLHIISLQFPDSLLLCEPWSSGSADQSTSADIFYQCVELLVWDLLLLANKRYPTTSNLSQVVPFGCGCERELVIMLMHLLKYRQQQFGKQSFRVMLPSIINSLLQSTNESVTVTDIDNDVIVLPPKAAYADPLAFCWWVLMHTAPLVYFDLHGTYNLQQETVESNYLLLTQLLKSSLLAQESQLRCYLASCMWLSELWEANLQVVIILWEHFYKKLNNQFHVPDKSIASLACVSKTALGLLDQCHSLIEKSNQSINLTSYQLFLKLLVVHLRKSTKDGVCLYWKQLKGRFYSKFNARRMQELNEVGLYNISMLFLVLSHVVHVQDVGSKLFELMQMLDSRRRSSIWKSSFALILRYLDEGHDIGFVAEKLALEFNVLCKEFSQEVGGGQSCSRQLLMSYIEDTQDVLEASSDALHQCHLLGEGFHDLLRTGSVNDLIVIFNFVQALLTRHRVVYRRMQTVHQNPDTKSTLAYCKDLSDALWRLFYSFVKDHVCTLTPPRILADIAAGFALLFPDMPPSVQTGIKESFVACFTHFGCGEQVNAEVCCRFLCHMMPNDSVMQRLADSLPNHSRLLVAAWFRCVWLLPRCTEMLQELTRLMLKMDTMKKLLMMDTIEETGDSYEDVARQFIRVIGKRYQKLQDLKSKIDYRAEMDVYFRDVPKHLCTIVKINSVELLHSAYHWAGHVVRHCASLLYVKSKVDCILPVILDRLVLPRLLLNPDKPLPAHMLNSLAETLPMYLQGISLLDYKRDAYVERKLKEIVTQFLSRFPLGHTSNTATKVHPFLVALTHKKYMADDCLFRLHVLEIIAKEYLCVYTSTATPNVIMVLNFLFELCNKTVENAQIASDCSVLLSSVLSQLLLNDNIAVGQIATKLMQVMIEASRDGATEQCSDQLKTVLQQFLCHMKTHHSRVLKVLEPISILNPCLLHHVLPSITHSLKHSEVVRGVGVDKTLRLHYHNLLKNLGERGSEEWSRLLLES